MHRFIGKLSFYFRIITIVLLSGCASEIENNEFFYIPETKATVSTNLYNLIKKNSIVTVSADSIKSNETLFLCKCENICKSAKVFVSLSKEDFEKNNTQKFTINEEAIYYFWLREKTEQREFNHSYPKDISISGQSVSVKYSSGTEIRVSFESENRN